MMFARTPYEEFHAETYSKFHELTELARRVGAPLHVPEVVFVGVPGAGKTSLLEAVLGQPLYQHRTQRAVRVEVRNNPSLENGRMRLTLRRDAALLHKGAPFNADAECGSARELAQMLAQRNTPHPLPCEVVLETAAAWDAAFLDTPGVSADELRAAVEAPPAAAARAALGRGRAAQVAGMVAAMRMERRLLVVVQSCEADGVALLDAINKVDPGYARTVFAYSHFRPLIDAMPSNKELAKFCSGLIGNAANFLVENVASDGGDAAAFRKRTLDAQRGVVDKLEALHFDRAMERFVGAPAFRGHLLEWVWKYYMDGLPQLVQHLSETRARKQEQLYDVKATLLNLDSFRMRNLMATLAMAFLKDVEALIEGTIDGLPAVNGMSLAEELDADAGPGPWVDADFREIAVKAEAWRVPWPEQRLFGRQQFERLLSQFRSIALNARIAAIRPDAVACSVGPAPLTTGPQLAWVASDVAQQQARRLLQPLLSQLHERVLFVMERLVGLVEVVRAKRTRAAKKSAGSSVFGAAAGGQQQSAADYPYFFHQVKDVYMRYVRRIGEQTMAKCLDEFYCTRIVYWDMLNFGDYDFSRPFKDMSLDDRKEECLQLAKTLFSDHRTRIVNNVLMKYHNFFLSTLQADIWANVQGEFAALSDAEVSALFELEANQKDLKDCQESLEKEFMDMGGIEASLREAQMNFSHPR